MAEALKQMMNRLNLGGKAPRCPLCHEFMVKKFEPNRGFFIFACDTDMVAIRVDDPFVGKWDQAYDKVGPIDCPSCGKKVRYFATSTGYMKAVCPKCKASMATSEPDREKDTVVATPEKPGVVQ